MPYQVRFKNRCRQLALDDYNLVDMAVDWKSNDVGQCYTDSVSPFILFTYTYKTFRLSFLILGIRSTYAQPYLETRMINLVRRKKRQTPTSKFSSPAYGLIGTSQRIG